MEATICSVSNRGGGMAGDEGSGDDDVDVLGLLRRTERRPWRLKYSPISSA